MADRGRVPGAEVGVDREAWVTLTGTFDRGSIALDDRTVPLNEDGEGRTTLRLAPPGLEVRLLVAQREPAEFRFTVMIGERVVTEEGEAPPGELLESFRYPLARFGLGDGGPAASASASPR